MINNADFSKRLQIVMDYYGLSASALADEIACNRSSISHLLSGRNKPSLEIVLKLLEKYPEVQLYWLLNGKGHFPDIKSKENTVAVENAQKVPPTQKNIVAKEKEVDIQQSRNQETEREIEKPHIDRIVIFFKNGSFKEYKSHYEY